MMPSDGIVASLMEPDAAQRSGRTDSSRAKVERVPDRPDRANELEGADAVGADFENLLKQVAGLRDSEAYTDGFARQVAEANRHAAANQRITDDDLRVPDEQQRSSARRAFSGQDPSQASAVAIQRGELGKGELGHLYRPLSAAGAGPRSEVAADLSSKGDLANSRGSSGHSADTGDRAARKGADPVESGKSLTGQKFSEAPNALAKASGVADARTSAAAMTANAAHSSVRRAHAPSNNRNTPGSERTGRSVQSQVRQPVVQRSSEPSPQSQSRQDSDLGARDMKKPIETPARTDSGSKAKGAERLNKQVEQKTLNDVQRVLMTNRGERHSRVRLQLRPPELGQLTIEMRMENDTLRIRFEAERPEIGELLKNNAAALSNALAEQGISVERYEVVLSDAASESDEFGQQLDAHGGLQDSFSESDARLAAEGNEESDRIEGEEGQAEEEGAPADDAERRLDIKA
jgi:flagellar hook-length control protein FliK